MFYSTCCEKKFGKRSKSQNIMTMIVVSNKSVKEKQPSKGSSEDLIKHTTKVIEKISS